MSKSLHSPIILLFVTASLVAQDPSIVLEDTTQVQAPSDSARYYRPPKPEKPKSLDFNMSEYKVKSSLARLSYYAQGRYISRYYALENMFIEANRLPEDVKNKMFGLALAGGLAQEVFKETRKELKKRKIGFIYPTLYGLNVSYPVRSLDARLYFRTMSPADRYYGLSLYRGKVHLTYRQTDRYEQKAFYLRICKNVRLFGLNTQYARARNFGIGISNYSKKLFLYGIYLINPEAPQYNRATVYLNINFDRY